MNVLFMILSFLFVFLITFGGTILGKLIEDYRTLKREEIRRTP